MQQLADDGGWGSATGAIDAGDDGGGGGGVSSEACDVAVVHADAGAAVFRDYARREQPRLVRNGSRAAWAQLRAAFARSRLIAAHGDLTFGVSDGSKVKAHGASLAAAAGGAA